MYKLTDTLPFMLYTISNHLSDSFAIELAEHKLTVSMYRVLAALLEREDQRLGELSDMIHIELSTLSRLIGGMKKRGLVSRRRHQSDERSVRINLTVEGRRTLEGLIPRAQYYERLAVRTLDRTQVTSLKATLSGILDDIAAVKKAQTSDAETVSTARPKRAVATK